MQTATSPPTAEIGVGCTDGDLELFGCYSPRNATNPVGELFQELAGMMLGSPNDMQVGEAAASLVEQHSCQLDREAIVQEMHGPLPPTVAVAGAVISRQEMYDGATGGRRHVGVEVEAQSTDGDMQQMAPSRASLGEQVVALDNEDVGIGESGPRRNSPRASRAIPEFVFVAHRGQR